MPKNFTTEEIFDSAVEIVRNLPKQGPIKPSDELKLKLYALFKQATHGPNDTSRPRFYQVVELYKWDAWKRLGDISKDQAMINYTQELKQIIDSIPTKNQSKELGNTIELENLLGPRLFNYWFESWGVGRFEPCETTDQESDSRTNGDDEETTSEVDGYKTPPPAIPPNETLSTDVSDQIASAVIRLQRGLERTNLSNSFEIISGSQPNIYLDRHQYKHNLNQAIKNWRSIMSSQQAFDTNCMTLSRFLIGEQRKYPTATGELTTLLNALQTAIKSVSSAVRRAGMTNMFGLANVVNTSGEDVKRLDVLSNELFINMLRASFTTHKMISEENEDIIVIEEDKAGKYFIAFDPLDGSSNIEASVSIGSIFAIYRNDPNSTSLPCGRDIVAAGYALYGSSTVVVLAINDSVHCFMLDPMIGEFILTEPNIRIKPRGKIYSVNEGYHSKWDEAMKSYIHKKKYPTKEGEKPYSGRYVGSMVADMHRTFKYGGIFIYPRTADATNGKLRLLYECNPMAFIVEKAGGKAMASPGLAILDIKPEVIHQRTPIFIGSNEDVDEVMAEYTNLNLK